MSVEYDLYLNEHRANTKKAFDWLLENVLETSSSSMKTSVINAIYNIKKHDESKYSDEEYIAYDNWFYKHADEHTEQLEKEFNMAWLHHIHNNPHHWQHWVLVNDDAELGTIALEMPYEYVIEMVCDWWSFSWKSESLYEIFNWYDKNKSHMIMHEKTRDDVENILSAIKSTLDGYIKTAISKE